MNPSKKTDCPDRTKENLCEMKSHYQDIPIPEHLKSQVEASILQAKLDLAAETHSSQAKEGSAADTGTGSRCRARPRILAWGKGISAAAAAAMLALAALANSSASAAHAMEQVPFLGAIVDIVTFREYGSRDGNMEANLKIPSAQVKDAGGSLMEDATDQLNSQIQAYTDEIIAAYQADAEASGGEAMESVDLSYEVATDNDTLFSLRFYQTHTMASAAQSEKIYHIDKGTGNMVTLKDLFQEGTDYKGVISQNIKEQMQEQMEEDEGVQYYIADKPATYYPDGQNPLDPAWDFSEDFTATPMEDGTAEETDAPEEPISEEGFQEIPDDVDFYVNGSGKLVVVFDEYEVAPGYMGAVSFEIPTSLLKDIVKEGYLK